MAASKVRRTPMFRISLEEHAKQTRKNIEDLKRIRTDYFRKTIADSLLKAGTSMQEKEAMDKAGEMLSQKRFQVIFKGPDPHSKKEMKAVQETHKKQVPLQIFMLAFPIYGDQKDKHSFQNDVIAGQMQNENYVKAMQKHNEVTAGNVRYLHVLSYPKLACCFHKVYSAADLQSHDVVQGEMVKCYGERVCEICETNSCDACSTEVSWGNQQTAQSSCPRSAQQIAALSTQQTAALSTQQTAALSTQQTAALSTQQPAALSTQQTAVRVDQQVASLCVNEGETVIIPRYWIEPEESSPSVHPAGTTSTNVTTELHHFLHHTCNNTLKAEIVFNGHGDKIEIKHSEELEGVLKVFIDQTVRLDDIVSDIETCFSRIPPGQPPFHVDIVFAQCYGHLQKNDSNTLVVIPLSTPDFPVTIGYYVPDAKEESYHRELQNHAKKVKVPRQLHSTHEEMVQPSSDMTQSPADEKEEQEPMDCT